MKLLFILFALQLALAAQQQPKHEPKEDHALQKSLGMPFPVGINTMFYNQADYKGMVTAPKDGRVTIEYEKLLPGPRGFGGCAFEDKTKKGSYMPIVEHDDKHVTVKAPAGHKIEWSCRWNVRKQTR